MKKIFIIIVTFISTSNLFGQVKKIDSTEFVKLPFKEGPAMNLYDGNSCDKATIEKLEKKFNKADKKGKTVNREFADMAFQIAECYRQKNDTVFIVWYLKAVELQKGLYIYYKKSYDKILALERTALSYYYAKQYKNAALYFSKVTICPNSSDKIECLYFEGLNFIQLRQFKDALLSLKSYKDIGDKKYNVNSLITSCENKINDK